MIIADGLPALFLAHFPPRQRAHVAALFVQAARAGHTDPADTVRAVLAALRERLGVWGHENREARALVGLLQRHQSDALVYAAWVYGNAATPRQDTPERLYGALAS